MPNLKQEDIIQKWPKNWNAPEVSVRCITYNHAPFIAQALDSFLIQKTDFPFEVVVHDDASTDETAVIIREYEEKYPLIIKPIYEIENQYSKKDGSLERIMAKACCGKYIAFCEGDDYWCDEHKLQTQYDILENNSEYSACAHNTRMINLSTKKEKIFFPKKDIVARSTDCSMSYHLSSLMCRKETLDNRPEFIFKSLAPGDVMLDTYLKICGPIYRLGDVMSVYRLGVPGSWMKRIGHNKELRLKNSENVLSFYEEIRNWAPDRFYSELSLRIDHQRFLILCRKGLIRKARHDYPDIWNNLSLNKKIRFLYELLRKSIKTIC